MNKPILLNVSIFLSIIFDWITMSKSSTKIQIRLKAAIQVFLNEETTTSPTTERLFRVKTLLLCAKGRKQCSVRFSQPVQATHTHTLVCKHTRAYTNRWWALTPVICKAGKPGRKQWMGSCMCVEQQKKNKKLRKDRRNMRGRRGVCTVGWLETCKDSEYESKGRLWWKKQVRGETDTRVSRFVKLNRVDGLAKSKHWAGRMYEGRRRLQSFTIYHSYKKSISWAARESAGKSRAGVSSPLELQPKNF